MSSRFSVRDFNVVGELAIELYNFMSGMHVASGGLGHQLSSCNIVIQELQTQASDPESLLNQRGIVRRTELLQMMDNVRRTLREIDILLDDCEKMGWDAWERYQLGQKYLAELRERLRVLLGLVDSFVSTLMMAAVGRLEPMMEVLFVILRQFVQKNKEKILKFSSSQGPVNPQTWDLLQLELGTNNVPLQYIRENRDQIQMLVTKAINERDILDADFGVDDIVPQRDTSPEVLEIDGSSTSGQSSAGGGASGLQPGLEEITEEQERSVQFLFVNAGFQIGRIWKTKDFMFSRIRCPIFGRDFGSRDYDPELQALCWATRNGHLMAARVLLRNGAHPKLRGGDERPVLVTAAEKGYTGIVNVLPVHGFDANITDPTRILYNANRFVYNLTALHFAVVNGHEATARLLLEYGANPAVRCEDAHLNSLDFAAGKGHVGIIQLLLAHGAEINAQTERKTALHEAARSGQVVAIKELRRNGAAVSGVNATALHYAADEGNIGAAVALLGAGTDVETLDTDSLKFRPLHCAVARNRVSFTKVLLDHGAAADALTGSGFSALFLAAYKGYEGIADALLESGASRELAWFTAVQCEHEASLRMLLRKGASFTCKNEAGIDALQWTVRERKHRTIAILIALGLPLGGPGNYGYEALREAALGLDEDAVALLLDNGVRVDVTTLEGKKLLGHQTGCVNTGIIRRLEEASK